MNKRDKLTEATMLALQGKLNEVYTKEYIGTFSDLYQSSWGPAKEVLEHISDLGLEQECMDWLEDFGTEDNPIDRTELNDYIWNNSEDLYTALGLDENGDPIKDDLQEDKEPLKLSGKMKEVDIKRKDDDIDKNKVVDVIEQDKEGRAHLMKSIPIKNKNETKYIKVKGLRKLEGIRAVEEYEYEFDDLYNIVGSNGKSVLDDIKNANKVDEFMVFLASIMSEDVGKIPTVGELSDFIDYDYETIFRELDIKQDVYENKKVEKKLTEDEYTDALKEAVRDADGLEDVKNWWNDVTELVDKLDAKYEEMYEDVKYAIDDLFSNNTPRGCIRGLFNAVRDVKKELDNIKFE